MKKRLLLLPILAGFVLTGCDINDLKLWEKVDFSDLAFWNKDKKEEVIDDSGKESGEGDKPTPGPGPSPVTTEWPATVQSLMKEHLDNEVLPYIEGTWTWDYDEDYGVYGLSYDVALAKVTSAFSSWENLGEDADGDTWYGKETTNGEIKVVPYASTDENQQAMVVIQAYYYTVDEDWSESSKTLMTEYMGFTLPFIKGVWEEFEEGEGYIGTTGTNVDMAQAKTVLEGNDYVVSLDEYQDISATKETELYIITVDLEDWTAIYGVFTLEITKTEKIAKWPGDEIAEYVGTYMDFEPEVVPEPENAVSFAISEGDYGMIISCSGATQEEYMALLSGLEWEISDYYLDEYGIYSAYSPNGTIEIDIYDGVSPLKIEIMSAIPEFDSWPSQYVDPFVSETIGSVYSLPAFEGQDTYCYNEALTEDSTGATYMSAVLAVYSENLSEATFKDYSDLLESLGFEVEYSPEDDEYYASFAATHGKIAIEGTYYSEVYYMYYFEIYALDVDENPIIIEENTISLLAGGSKQIGASLPEGFEGELSFASKNEEVATVTSEGEVTAVAKGSTEIEVSVMVGETKFTSTVTVNVLEQATEVSIVGDSEVKNGKSADYSISFPEGTYSPEEPVWSIVSGEDYASIDAATGKLTAVASVEEDKEVVISVTVGELSNTKTITVKAVSEVQDTLTLAKLGLSGIGTSYTAFSNIKDESDAVYGGKCAGNYESIQLRSKSQDSGVYSTTSGGKIKSVTVIFSDSDTGYEDGVKIVASNEPFTSVSALHSATVVGTISNNDTTHGGTYVFEEDYAYVGVISQKGAHYIDSITFVWGN